MQWYCPHRSQSPAPVIRCSRENGPKYPSAPCVAIKSATNRSKCARNSLSCVMRSASTAEIRYLPANSPAHGTRSRCGARSRSRNICSMAGFEAGAINSQLRRFALMRSPTKPPNSNRARRGASNTVGAARLNSPATQAADKQQIIPHAIQVCGRSVFKARLCLSKSAPGQRRIPVDKIPD